MSNSNTQKLVEINEKIKNLKAVKCRITHEKVQIDEKTNLPISKYIGEKVYERIGFCPKDVREERISCSHTMATEILHSALNLLGEKETILNLRNNLMDLVFQIHQLDHQKSDVERDLAILIERKTQNPNKTLETEIDLATEKIKNIENEHDQRVDGIAEVRDQIVIEIEKSTNPKLAI